MKYILYIYIYIHIVYIVACIWNLTSIAHT